MAKLVQNKRDDAWDLEQHPEPQWAVDNRTSLNQRTDWKERSMFYSYCQAKWSIASMIHSDARPLGRLVVKFYSHTITSANEPFLFDMQVTLYGELIVNKEVFWSHRVDKDILNQYLSNHAMPGLRDRGATTIAFMLPDTLFTTLFVDFQTRSSLAVRVRPVVSPTIFRIPLRMALSCVVSSLPDARAPRTLTLPMRYMQRGPLKKSVAARAVLAADVVVLGQNNSVTFVAGSRSGGKKLLSSCSIQLIRKVQVVRADRVPRQTRQDKVYTCHNSVGRFVVSGQDALLKVDFNFPPLLLARTPASRFMSFGEGLGGMQVSYDLRVKAYVNFFSSPTEFRFKDVHLVHPNAFGINDRTRVRVTYNTDGNAVVDQDAPVMAAVAAPLYQARVVVPGNAAANNNNNAVPNNNNNDVDNRRHDDNDVVELQDDVDDKLEPALLASVGDVNDRQRLQELQAMPACAQCGFEPSLPDRRKHTACDDFNAHLALRREFERLESLLAVVELKCVALEGRDEHTFTARVPPHSSVAGLRRFIEDSTGRVVDELLVFGSPLPPDAEMTSLVDLEVEVVFGAAAGVAVACHKCQTVSNSDEEMFCSSCSALLIDRLPKVQYDEAMDVTECAVCFVDFVTADQIAVLPCLHSSFHDTCLAQWLRKKECCPVCSTDITPSNLSVQ